MSDCWHESMSGADNLHLEADGKLWRCDACGVVLRCVHDPNGSTTVGSIGGSSWRVRYEVVDDAVG